MSEKETRHQSYLNVYFCGSENCPSRHAYGPAVRPHYLLHVILKGKGIYQYKGQTYSHSARDTFLILSWEALTEPISNGSLRKKEAFTQAVPSQPHG